MQSFKKYISESPELDEGKGKPGLWANIHAKRKRGERPAKPGEEGYPKTLNIEEIDEAIKASDYVATSEKSQFGGHRPHVVNKSTGKTMHLSAHAYKSPEHAKAHATEYIDAYSKIGPYAADRAGQAYAKANKDKQSVKESVELQELSKSLLHAYKNKAELSIPKDDREYANRSKGIEKAADRLTKEEVEQIDELSKSTLGSYVKKANTSAMSAAHAVGSKRSVSDTEPHINKMFKRKAGVEKATDRLTKESVEQLDELSPNLLHRYVKKATGNMGMHAVDHGKYGDQQKDKKSLNKAIKRSSGIASASGRMADKANKNEEFTPAEKAAFLAAANKKASLDYWKTHAELKKNDPRVSKKPKNESVDLDESEINNIAAQYINENNITLEQLENMTEAELNELIAAAVGGAFKLGAKAAVGATRLAGRAINRMTTSGRADAAEKKASTLEKKNADRERIKAAQDRLRKAKEAASKR